MARSAENPADPKCNEGGGIRLGLNRVAKPVIEFSGRLVIGGTSDLSSGIGRLVIGGAGDPFDGVLRDIRNLLSYASALSERPDARSPALTIFHAFLQNSLAVASGVFSIGTHYQDRWAAKVPLAAAELGGAATKYFTDGAEFVPSRPGWGKAR
jgi:hypothetical protein